MTDRDSLAAMLGMVEAVRAADWMERALCRDSDPDSFFPSSARQPNVAIALCLRCPVKQECFEFGMGEKFGVWGGTSENDRKKIRRLQRKEMVVA